jgi:hypothetical protein
LISSLDLFGSGQGEASKIVQTPNGPSLRSSSTQKMQLVKIAIAIVAVALTPSEGAENHADNKALLSQQVANLLRGSSHSGWDWDGALGP